MKPDGVSMETTEPSEGEAATVTEPSSLQENITEQAPSQADDVANDTALTSTLKANGKPVPAQAKVKPKAGGPQTKLLASAGASSSQPGTASNRTANDVRSASGVSAAPGKKTAATSTVKTSSLGGAVCKRLLGTSAVSTTAKNQTRVPDMRSAGPARTTSVAAATVTNGTKPSVNGTHKKELATETVNGAKPKTTAVASRAPSTAPKTSALTTAKAATRAASKTTRPSPGLSTSRPTSATSRPPAATTKLCTTQTAKTVSRVNTTPSTGRSTSAQPKPPPAAAAAAKKDVTRPPLTKKPTTAAAATTKKPEPFKPVSTTSKSSTTKPVDSKASQFKPTQPAKHALSKIPIASHRLPATSRPPFGQTPPSSPANKAANGTPSKTKTVPPFSATKKKDVSNTTTSAEPSESNAAAAAAVLTETQAEATAALPQESSFAAPEEVPAPALPQETTAEMAPQEAPQSQEVAHSPPPCSETTLPEKSLLKKEVEGSAPLTTTTAAQEPTPSSVMPSLSPEASTPDLSEANVDLLTDQASSASAVLPAAADAVPQIVLPANLNEEEDEEEREGSQLVSVSEMSGATQPTEESDPGSAGLVGGSLRVRWCIAF